MPATRKRSTGGRTTSRTNGRQSNRSGKDAISLLKEDHAKVLQLFKRLERATERGGGEEIMQQIENELKVHTQIEEEIFYPAFKGAVEGKKDERLYYESLEEHHVVDLVIPEINATSPGSEAFAAKTKVLKDIVEHHAKEEEEKMMFPRARRAMGVAQLREVGQQLQERKQQLMGGTMNRALQSGKSAISRILSPITGGRGKKTTTNGRNRGRAA
jgi:hypothetical protein